MYLKEKLFSRVWFKIKNQSLFTVFLHVKEKSFFILMLRKSFHTISINLLSKSDDLFASFEKNTRNEINRSEKEGIKFNTSSNINDGVIFYNKFAAYFGLNGTDTNRLEKLNVYITKATLNDICLVKHIYIYDNSNKIIRLLYSGNNVENTDIFDRKTIGWANRGLHWFDILDFKEKGFKEYDLGGIAVGNKLSNKVIGINKFKKSFGGQEVIFYNYYGYLFLLANFLNNIFKKTYAKLKSW